jgi:hypothetical protein
LLRDGLLESELIAKVNFTSIERVNKLNLKATICEGLGPCFCLEIQVLVPLDIVVSLVPNLLQVLITVAKVLRLFILAAKVQSFKVIFPVFMRIFELGDLTLQEVWIRTEH